MCCVALACTHGVVYYVNFLFRAESARDHVDGFLSFNSFPTVYILDVAGQVARHMNNRTQQKFFHRHDGQLCAPSKQNIEAAMEKKLEFDLDWVNNLRSPEAPQQRIQEKDWFTASHLITKTNHRYALYDRFHKKTKKTMETRGKTEEPEHLPLFTFRGQFVSGRTIQSRAGSVLLFSLQNGWTL